MPANHKPFCKRVGNDNISTKNTRQTERDASRAPREGLNPGMMAGGQNLDLTGHLKKMIEALDEASLVTITDKDGIITHVNRRFCDASEYSASELVGKNPRILRSGFHPPEFYKDLWATISAGRTWHGEMKNVGKNGKVFWMDTTIVPFLDAGGVPEQYIALCNDVTSKKNTEESLLDANLQLRKSARIQEENMRLHIEFEKLKERDKLKSELSAMFSHELKTPLVTISGYIEMLKEGVLGAMNADQQDAINMMGEESDKLLRLIEDLMDAQKLDLRQLKFKKDEFQVEDFMEEVIQLHAKLMDEKKIRFVNLTGEKIRIVTDRDRLSQVFANLIKNSVDFVPSEGGSIEISASVRGGEVLFYVRDNGCGIPREKQQNLFGKFYQIDTSLKRKHGGTGLGLVICKGILEALGGKIWVESDIGSGATFYFTLPASGMREQKLS